LVQTLAKNDIDSRRYKLPISERNFDDVLLKAEKEKADMFMLLALPPAMDIIVKALKEKNIKTPYTSIETPGAMKDKAAFEGVEYVDAPDGSPEFIERYKRRFKTEDTYGAAFAYDAMMIINRIVNNFYARERRIPKAPEMTKEMFNLGDWVGAVGLVTVGSDRVLESEAVIKKIVDGKPVTVEK
jgi:ABC-type branched-subunit amino acid transport system substrate-binding protein